MIDINTHRVIDLIKSRELADVSKWLKSFPNLEIVSRDGSITYHNAVSCAHPNAIQISDCFHLLKNLTSYCTDYLKKELKANVFIPITTVKLVKAYTNETIILANSNRKLTLQEKFVEIEDLLSQGKNKTQICQALNMDIRVYNKLLKISHNERNNLFSTRLIETRKEKETLKMELVQEVRLLKQEGYSGRKISKETGLSRQTVYKYLDANFTPVHGSTGVKRLNNLTAFAEEIDGCLNQGLMGTVIEKQLRDKGYVGSSSTIRHYITNWKRNKNNMYDEKESINPITKCERERLERKDIFKLLYHPIEKVTAINSEQFESLCKAIPTFAKIHSTIWEFRRIFKEKELSSFDTWITTSRMLEIKEINSFINGLERDIDAVKNAIIYDYSNGLAEGSINKLKVIKRIMYGRCSFETLRIKTLRLEKMRKFN